MMELRVFRISGASYDSSSSEMIVHVGIFQGSVKAGVRGIGIVVVCLFNDKIYRASVGADG